MLGRQRVEAVFVGVGMQPGRGAGVLQHHDPVGDPGTGASDLDQAHPPLGEQGQNMGCDQVTGRCPFVPGLSDHHDQIRQIRQQLRRPEPRLQHSAHQARRALDTEPERPAHRHRIVIEKRCKSEQSLAIFDHWATPFGKVRRSGTRSGDRSRRSGR